MSIRTAKLNAVRRSWRLAALIGVMFLGLIANRDGTPLALLPFIGVILLAIAAMWSRRAQFEHHVTAVVLGGAFATGVFIGTGLPPGESWSSTPMPIWSIAIGGVITVSLFAGLGLTQPVVRLGLGALIAVFVVSGWWMLQEYPDSGFDVQDAHRQAADVLASGGNPYSEVLVVDSALPQWNVGEIVGYSYPPVTLIAYTAGEWLSDSRIVSILAIVLMMLILWHKEEPWERPSVGLVGLMALLPITGLVIVSGWTEPLQVLLLIAAAALVRRPVPYAIVLGLAIASKQYMVLAAVPMLVSSVDHLWKRMGIAATVAAATILPFFLWNPSAMWNALVAFQFDRPIRGDSTSIWSLGMEVPIVVALLAAVAVGVALGWRRTNPAQLLLAQAATIGTYFLLSPNSFGNYWYFVAAVALAAVAMHPGPDAEDPGSSEASLRNEDPQAIEGMQL